MSPGRTEAGFVCRNVLKPNAPLWPDDRRALSWVFHHINLIETVATPDEPSNQLQS